MSTKTGNDANPNSSGAGGNEEEREGGLIPAILAGAGILAVVGLLVFWPSGDDDASDRGKGAKNGGKARVAAGAGPAGADAKNGGKSAQGGGGVGARPVDAATPAASAAVGRVNPALKPQGLGMAPAVPQEEPPPKFNNVQEEIDWYEGRLSTANTHLEKRRENAGRLPRAKQRAEDSANPTQALANFEKRKKIVESNVTKAEAKVAEIEKKLAELRGE